MRRISSEINIKYSLIFQGFGVTDTVTMYSKAYLIYHWYIKVTKSGWFGRLINFCLLFMRICHLEFQWSLLKDPLQRRYFSANPAYLIQHEKIVYGSVAMTKSDARIQILRWLYFPRKNFMRIQRWISTNHQNLFTWNSHSLPGSWYIGKK